MGIQRPITDVDAAAYAVAGLHRTHGDWRSTREAVEILAHVVAVGDDDGEAAYYGLSGMKLARAELADRVLITLDHPTFTGDEHQAALLEWCAEWTRESCLEQAERQDECH